MDAAGEVRSYCVDGRVEETLWTRFDRPDDAGDDAGKFTTFHEVPRAEALRAWCGGDEAAFADAEKAVRSLVEDWLVWLRALDADPQPFVRVDVFVKARADGRVVVRSGEVTELGASFLGWAGGPARVFEAFLRNCFRDARCAESERCACSLIAADDAAAAAAAPKRRRKHRSKKKRKLLRPGARDKSDDASTVERSDEPPAEKAPPETNGGAVGDGGGG